MTLDSNTKFLKMLYSEILWPAHETYELHNELTNTLDIEVKKVYIAEISEYILIAYKSFHSFLSNTGYAYINVLNYLNDYIDKNKLNEYIIACDFGKDYTFRGKHKIGIKLNPKYNDRVEELFNLLKLQGIIE